MKNIIVNSSETGERIDAFLAQKFPTYSRSYFSRLLKNSDILINDKPAKPSYLLRVGDTVEIRFKEIEDENPPIAEEIPLEIIFEDKNVIIINKQPGLVVHPAAGNQTGTLVNALLHHFPKIEESVVENGNKKSITRAGIVHRLDKDTSGAIIAAKNSKTLYSLSKQIKDRAVTKIYWALVYGWPKNDEGILKNYLGRHPKNRKMVAEVGENKGREAISHYKVVEYFEMPDGIKAALVEFDIKTGRTHQIRVQSAIIGHPVVGDSTYGNKLSNILSHSLGATRQMLHAKSISITIPGEKSQRIFEAVITKDFAGVLKKLRKNHN